MGYKTLKSERERYNYLKYAIEVWLTFSEREQQAIYDALEW